jgi:hypothetical protein
MQKPEEPLLAHAIRAMRWLQEKDERVTEIRLEKLKQWIYKLRDYAVTFDLTLDSVISPLLGAYATLYEMEPLDASSLQTTLQSLVRAQEALEDLPRVQQNMWDSDAPTFRRAAVSLLNNLNDFINNAFWHVNQQ